MTDTNAPTFIVPRKAFADALAFLTRNVIERRNTTPILSGVLLESANDGEAVNLSGTDLDLQAIATVPAVATDWRRIVAADAFALSDAVKRAKGDDLTFSQVDGKLVLEAQGSTTRLQVLPPDDFPAVKADAERAAEFTLPAGWAAGMLQRVRPAISTEETRYYLNGILIRTMQENGAARLACVATDGHRLHVQTCDQPDGAADLPDSIIPSKTIKAIARLVGKGAADVRCSFAGQGSKPAVFTVGNVVLRSKLVDGSYPDYTRVIPTQNDKRLTVDAGALSDAFQTAAAISTDKARAVRLDITGDKVTASCASPEHGVAKADVVPVSYLGRGDDPAADMEIGFNASYARQLLGLFDGEVTLTLADAAAPTLFTSPDAPGFLAVLMPMRVGGEPAAAAVQAPAARAYVSPQDPFRHDYGAAYKARDHAGMAAAVEARRASMSSRYSIPTERETRYTAAQEAQVVRQTVDGIAKAGAFERARRDRLRFYAASLRDFVARGYTKGVCSPSSYLDMMTAWRNVEALDRLEGWNAADPRDMLPVALADGSTVTIAKADLLDGARTAFSERTPAGKVKGGRGARTALRRDIIGILPPKLSAKETDAKVAALDRANQDLQRRLAEVEARLSQLELGASQPPAETPVEVPAEVPVDPVPVAPAEPVPAVEVEPVLPSSPVPLDGALGSFGGVFTIPAVVIDNGADAAAVEALQRRVDELEAAHAAATAALLEERQLRRSQVDRLRERRRAERFRTAQRMSGLRTRARGAERCGDAARVALQLAEGRFVQAEAEAEALRGRLEGIAGLLGTSAASIAPAPVQPRPGIIVDHRVARAL